MHRLVAAFALTVIALAAQTNRGSIAGTITDPSKAVISGAAITITNLGTNERRKLASAESGTFLAADLEPVLYRVEVEMQGFKKAVIENVKVDTASTAAVNVTLEPGSVDTKVTVSAQAAMLDTESQTAGATISERQVRDVPLVNRSVLDLALTLPNVSGDAGSENPGLASGTPCPGCNLSIGGGRPLSSMIMADGTNNTGVSLARSMVSFTPETVQEFTVLTSTYSAEYGTTGGGIIVITTKSGTNDLHGTLLWYNRNPDFAAAPWQTGATNRSPATLKYNQFSASAGGPVYIPKLYHGKNKTFWFAAIEPWYRRDHLDQYGLMPTDAMWNGDYSGMVNTVSGWLPAGVQKQFAAAAPASTAILDSTLYNQFNVVNGNQFQQIVLGTGQTYAPFPGNVIPKSMLDTAAQKAKAYIAPAGAYFLDPNGNISNLMAPRLLSQDETRYTARIDQVISDINRIYGRFTVTPIVKLQGTPVSPTNYGASYSWGKQAMLADTHTFSPTLFNDLRLNYTRGRFSNTVAPTWDPATGQNLNTAFGLPSITNGGLPSFTGLFPGKTLGNNGSTATGFGGAGSTEVDDREERYAITDIVYKSLGATSLKFGVDMSHSLQNVIPLYGSFGGIYAFNTFPTNSTGTSAGTGGNAFASFLLGVPNNGGSPAVTLRNVEVPYYYRWNSGAAFIQDDWKARPNLTLHFGLRYSLEMPRTEKYDHQGVFRADLAQTVNLPTPLALNYGGYSQTISSTQIVPFAFSGVGGNSRYLTPPRYTDFEPRFGFAWSPSTLQKHHVTMRGGWGMSHAPISGFSQLPSPDFGATNTGFTVYPSATAGSTTAQPANILRLGENPPVLTPATVQRQIYGAGGAPANGLSYANSLYYQQTFGGFTVSQNYRTPYVNNWSYLLDWQANGSTTVEAGYTGNQGIHLFMPSEDINPKNSDVLSAQLAANVSSTNTVADPLGRVNPITGKVLAVQNGTLASPYLGFSTLYQFYDASANSIRHAVYIDVTHRVGQGLTFITNYTLSKSIDDASSAGGDKNILTTGQTGGQVAFGGPRKLDRAISTFDQTHVFHATAIYDLPIGRGRKFLAGARKPLDALVGGWTTTALVRANSGFPFIDVLSDSNQLGDLTHTARPNLVPGVPILNPLYNATARWAVPASRI